MSKLHWRVGSGGELAQLLMAATLEESAAVSGATVYRLNHENKEKIAISLPGGQVVLIEQATLGRPRRRRLEPVAVETPTPSEES